MLAVAAAHLVLSFVGVFILFGLRNLIANPTFGIFSLAAMAVLFGGVLSGVGVMLRRPQGPPEPDA